MEGYIPEEKIQQMLEDIREKTIDEFANNIRQYSGQHFLDYKSDTELVFKTDDWLDYISKKMKGGAEE